MIDRYLQEVARQIRWKRARKPILDELQAQIEDQIVENLRAGMTGEEAVRRAVEAMGDPAAVGIELDRLHRPRPDFVSLGLIFALLCVGAVFNSLLNGSAQLLPILLGIVLAAGAYFSDFTLLARRPLAVFLGFMLISALLMLAADAHFVLGFIPQNRLHHLFLLFPPAMALLLYRMRTLGPIGILFAGLGLAVQVMIALRFDRNWLPFVLFGGAILFLTAAAGGIFGGKSRLSDLSLTCALLFPFLLSFGAANIRAWQEYGENSLQLINRPQIARLLAGANLIGSCKAESPVDWELLTAGGTYLPLELLAEYGWLALIGTLGLSFTLLIVGTIRCFGQKSQLGRMISLSILSAFGIQTLLYLLSCFGISPIFHAAGILPLLSPGGCGMAINLFLLGIMLSVFRSDDLNHDRIYRIPLQISLRDNILQLIFS